MLFLGATAYVSVDRNVVSIASPEVSVSPIESAEISATVVLFIPIDESSSRLISMS